MESVEKERLFWTNVAKAIAHDMGTPLSAMLGWLELLPTMRDPATAIAEMQVSLERLTELSRRLEMIASPYRLESCSLESIIADVVNFFEKRFPPSGGNLIFSKIIAGDPQAMCRRDLLMWVLESLIKNGVEALPEHRGEVTIRAFSSGKDCFIEVTDNGRGIPSQNADKIFNPGFTTKKNGRGIGLALGKYIIEEVHRGALRVKDSRSDGGTTMQIRLRNASENITGGYDNGIGTSQYQ